MDKQQASSKLSGTVLVVVLYFADERAHGAILGVLVLVLVLVGEGFSPPRPWTGTFAWCYLDRATYPISRLACKACNGHVMS